MSLSIKVIDVMPLDNFILLVTFENGVKKKYDVKQLFSQFKNYKRLEDVNFFNNVKVDCGGCAISWDDEIDISEVELWDNGIEL